MPRFRFTLEPLLEKRRTDERDEQLALARLERDAREIEERLAALRSRIDAERRALSAGLGASRVDLDAVGTGAHAVAALRGRAEQLSRRLAEAYRLVEEQRARLVEAARSRLAIEHLRDERELAWRRAIERREREELDEIAGRRAQAPRGRRS